ncbi:MAG: carbon-nitrogen hydrolase family protein [Candidatus Latescibacterota bacterium]|jgi:predicted amidohydrolase
MGRTVRLAAAQPVVPLIDYHLARVEEALDRVDANLVALVDSVRRAGRAGCDAVVLTEDTLGLHRWLAAHEPAVPDLVSVAVERMLTRLGEAAAEQRLYLTCCSDALEADGGLYNTAFLLGRDGHEIGRYHKVNLPFSELGLRRRGKGFPVFRTPDLGGVGLLVCYDLVFPEPIQCLALGGADVVFVPTMGAASMGSAELGRTAFRVRAADSLVYLVVAYRSAGSMVISPLGEVLAQGVEGSELVWADVDPFGGRRGGNAFDWQEDLRVRLFRERVPTAYGRLVEPTPPALTGLPSADTPEEMTRRANRVLTEGEDRFAAAEALERAGRVHEAVRAYGELRRDFPGSWIERVAGERLAALTA